MKYCHTVLTSVIRLLFVMIFLFRVFMDVRGNFDLSGLLKNFLLPCLLEDEVGGGLRSWAETGREHGTGSGNKMNSHLKSGMIFTFVIMLFLYCPPVLAADFSFADAWSKLLVSSDALAAKQSAVERQKRLREAAFMRHLPNISVSGNYVRLSKSLQADGSKMEPFVSPEKIESLLKKLAGTGKITPQFAKQMGAFLHGFSEVDSVTELSEQDVLSSALTVTWPLFTGGRILAAEQIAREQTKESKARLVLERKAQFVSLAKVYFGVVLAQKVLETRLEAENGLKIHHRHAVALEKQGQIARVERLKAQAAFDRSKVETGKARRVLEVAHLALSQMLHEEENVRPVNPLFVNRKLPQQDEFLRQTLASHPGLEILRAKREQAKGLGKVEKGLYFPQVVALGTYNLYKPDSLLGESTPDWMAGVGVSMTLFDNKGRSKKVQAARSALSQVRHLYHQARRDLSVLAQKKWKETVQAKEEFYGLESSVALAEENVRLQEKGFSQGLFTSLDVVDARLFLESVKTQRLVASYNYVTSLAELLALSGETKRFMDYQSGLQ